MGRGCAWLRRLGALATVRWAVRAAQLEVAAAARWLAFYGFLTARLDNGWVRMRPARHRDWKWRSTIQHARHRSTNLTLAPPQRAGKREKTAIARRQP